MGWGVLHLCVSLNVRKSVCELGESGVQRGKPLPVISKYKAAADWMVKNDLADLNSAGLLVLRSTSLVFKTCLHRPIKVTEPEQTRECSLWSLRRRLQRQGWLAVACRDASVMRRSFNQSNSSSVYLAILIDSHLAYLRKRLGKFCVLS